LSFSKTAGAVKLRKNFRLPRNVRTNAVNLYYACVPFSGKEKGFFIASGTCKTRSEVNRFAK
jgi:hypothetical protein